MLKKMTIVWVLGLLTIVPYSVYYLLFQAERSEYAFYMVLPLFWVFGFWGVVGPLLSALKVRRLFKTIEQCRTREDLARLFQVEGNEDTVIELLANENKIPKFLARRLYRYVLARFPQRGQES